MIGRSLTADPYVGRDAARNPGEWNRYAYVAGDPVNFWDPSGLLMEVPGTSLGQPPWPGFGTPEGFLVGDDFANYRDWDSGGGPSLRFQREYNRYRAIKDRIRQVKLEGTDVTYEELDCLAGMESTWEPEAVNVGGTRHGLFQWNENQWNKWTNIVRGSFPGRCFSFAAWSVSAARDVVMSGLLAVWAVQVRIIKSRHKARAFDGFGERELAKYGRPIYGLAILECARQLAAGNFDAAFEALDRYRRWVAGGRRGEPPF